MRRWLAPLCLAIGGLGCAHAPALPEGPTRGRVLLVLERDGASELHVLDRDGARRVGNVAPREARWVTPDTILVVVEAPAEEEFHLPSTRLRLVDAGGRPRGGLGGPGRHYDVEPSPDGAWLAVGVEAPGVGDSDLEIWSLETRERVASRAQSFEEPRWRPDGRALVASVLMADPESDDDLGGSMLGSSLHWPRLHRIRRDLGDPSFLWDGADARSLAPGGSLALWWDADGVFARQRGGLVRCDPMTGGCRAVFTPDADRRVVDGRRVGPHEAWLLTVEASDAFDRRQPDQLLRVDLRDGRVLSRWRTPAGVTIREIDAIGD